MQPLLAVNASEAPAGAKLDQLARVLGEHPSATLSRVEKLRPGIALEGEWVPDELVRAILEGTTPRLDRADGATLVKAAFTMARDKERPNWQEMTLPVLKNRLLALSSHAFDEADYGSPNLYYFVDQYPDLLSIRQGRPHRLVRLIADLEATSSTDRTESQNVPSTQPVRSRVRPDIWTATLDYRSGKAYSWNTELAVVEVASPSASRIEFPTVNADDLARWRSEFVSSLTFSEGEPDRDRIEVWLARGGATILLPPKYRGLWNGVLRDRVVERASEFFTSNELAVPEDLLVLVEEDRSKSPSEGEELRARIHALIDQLSNDELNFVNVPASALFRFEALKK